MPDEVLKCSSCGIDVLSRKNFVQFKCPSCGETEIIRCSQCKALSNKFVCKNCQFVGP